MKRSQVNSKKTKKNSNKLTKKDYIAKYIFLKILFGEFKINDFVYSESKMSEHFKTTNATVRVAYNNLIQRGILKAVKGKGYVVLKNIGSYMFDHYNNLSSLDFKKEGNHFNFFKDKKQIITLDYASLFITEETSIENLLDVFKVVFSKMEIDDVTLFKTYAVKDNIMINEYHYHWNEQLILKIVLRSDIDAIDLFDYQKHLTLK